MHTRHLIVIVLSFVYIIVLHSQFILHGLRVGERLRLACTSLFIDPMYI